MPVLRHVGFIPPASGIFILKDLGERQLQLLIGTERQAGRLIEPRPENVRIVGQRKAAGLIEGERAVGETPEERVAKNRMTENFPLKLLQKRCACHQKHLPLYVLRGGRLNRREKLCDGCHNPVRAIGILRHIGLLGDPAENEHRPHPDLHAA